MWAIEPPWLAAATPVEVAPTSKPGKGAALVSSGAPNPAASTLSEVVPTSRPGEAAGLENSGVAVALGIPRSTA